MATITLYHFTSLSHLPMIQEGGISRGDIPISQKISLKAPSFTSDNNRNRQGWSIGSAVDKLQVQISVEIDEDDPNLWSWSELVNKYKIKKKWINILASGGSDPNTWYIYMGVIPPSMFTNTEIFEKRQGLHPVYVIENGRFVKRFQELK